MKININEPESRFIEINSKMLKIKRALEEIGTSSTSHGLPNIIKSEGVFFKLFWSFFLIISSTYCFYSIAKSINSYLDWEVVTKIDVITEIPTQFPAVTFCNLDLFTTDYAKDILNKISNNTQDENIFNSKPLFNYSLDASFTRLLFLVYSMNENFTDDNRKKLSLPLKKALIECYFNSKECTPDDFDWFYNIPYGNCFTFNNDRNLKGERKKTQQKGILNGLSFKLFLGNPSNVNKVIKTTGVLLVVHNNSLQPMPLDGMNIANGEITYVNVKRTFSSKLENPYNDCKANLNKPDAFDSDFYRDTFKIYKTYTQNYCFDICFISNSLKECNCSIVFSLLTNPCNTLEKLECFNNNLIKLMDKISAICSPKCPLECESIDYSLSVSHSYFSSPDYFKFLKTKQIFQSLLNNSSNYCNNSVEIENEVIRKSIVEVNVFYDELKYTKVSQIAKMTFEDLMANIGGTLGLCIGISFLSFVEIFEAIIQLFMILGRKH